MAGAGRKDLEVSGEGQEMRLIDADALMTWFNDNCDVDEDVSVGCVSGVIEEQPEAVVRCENCEYWSKKHRMSDGKTARCNYFPDEENEYFEYTNHTDFCPNGERRSDE